jgi:hypothetical protein
MIFFLNGLMKSIYSTLLFVLFSCNSIKVKSLELDYTQDYVGKIKSIKQNTTFFDVVSKEGKSITLSTEAFFDRNNNITKQIDQNGKYKDDINYEVKNGVLIKSISSAKNNTNKIEYKYDKNKNLIQYNTYQNDTLNFSKKLKYDKYNNTIEIIYLHPTNKKLNSTSKYIYDYKKREQLIISFDENGIEKKSNLKFYFDKRGYLIKSEQFSNEEYKNISVSEYDKSGNILKKILYTNKDVREIRVYKNTYDQKGNITIREVFSNDKLTQKTTNEITYW